MQDPDALEGGDASRAWRYAHSTNIEKEEGGVRGDLFVYLDKKSIDVLARAPRQWDLERMSADDRARTAWLSWVKIVSAVCEVTGDADNTENMMESSLATRRLRMFDLFDVFMCLCEGGLDKISVEGQGRRGFVRCEEQEWEFCRQPRGTGKRGKWLHELCEEEESQW